jgi:predicted TIM-barrel fold metal-dependent hydrolase
MAKNKDFESALRNVISELKAPKSQNNSFGKYKYRNAEDILEAVKPLQRMVYGSNYPMRLLVSMAGFT